MSILVYDLCSADVDRRFSPFCWRTKLALKHKGLAFETEPVRFGTMEMIAFSGHDRVPVLVDGDKTVVESFDIACYLEDAYPDGPALFGGPVGRGEARFLNAWVDMVMSPSAFPLYVLDIFEHLHPDDRPYFRETREPRFGMTLEAFGGDREAKVENFRKVLSPLRATLAAQDFICGDTPAYGDYIVFGSFLSARAVSDFVLLDDGDPVHAWRARMMSMFEGYAAGAKGYPF